MAYKWGLLTILKWGDPASTSTKSLYWRLLDAFFCHQETTVMTMSTSMILEGAEGSLLSGSPGGQKTMGGTMMEDDLFSKKMSW